MKTLHEDLLSSWLTLSANLWNERFVKILSFNEAFVCNLLNKQLLADPDNPYLTVKTLCARTRLLKSQMNKTLNDLEKRGVIERMRFDKDRRLVFVRLCPEGEALYHQEHDRILDIVHQVIKGLGEEKAKTLTTLLNETAGILGELEKE